ncbi:MAG TPA: SPOR domain-containing protein [Roseiarcus sp.]|nr:SPOR domain-containing protein [Roseiarcus sp.]
MNVSGSRATDDINLDEYERRLRAAGGQQASAEDPLVELARLVESSRFGFSDRATSAEPVAEPAKAREESSPPIEIEGLRPTIDEAEDFIPAASEADREARQDYEFPTHPPDDANTAEQAAEGRPKGWMLKVSALALAGVAMIGAVLALKGGVPGLPKQPPFIAAAQGPTKVQPPSDDTVTASSDAGASLLKDNAKPASVKVVSSEEQPVDLSAQGSLGNPPPAAASPPAAADQGKPPASASSATPLAATVNTPLVPPPAAPPPPMTSEFPNPKPVRTVSLRPDGTPIAASNPPDQIGGDATPAGVPAQPPSKLGPKTMSDTAGVAQPSTPKLDLPTKLSAKSSARVVVAKTDTTAPDASAQTPTESTQPGAPVKPEKAAKKPKPAQATAEATETPAAPAAPPVDATAATASGGWAVQLAAPKSEAEANSEMARLTSKYGADLNGSSLGVHKAVVNGQTIYRLRVVGLTKADAAALCARLKGDGGECFIAK